MIAVDNYSDADAKLLRLGDGVVHGIHATENADPSIAVNHNRGRFVAKRGAIRARIHLAFGQTLKVQRDVAQTVSNDPAGFLQHVNFCAEPCVGIGQPGRNEKLLNESGEDNRRDIHRDPLSSSANGVTASVCPLSKERWIASSVAVT